MSDEWLVLDLPDETQQAFLDELGALDNDAIVRPHPGEGGHNLLRTNAGVRTVARALDHMRNSGVEGRGFYDERDGWLMNLGAPPLTYRLRSWQFTWKEQDQTFWSYTGLYEKDDRLVNGVGDAFTVFSVEHEATPVEAGVLLVERRV